MWGTLRTGALWLAGSVAACGVAYLTGVRAKLPYEACIAAWLVISVLTPVRVKLLQSDPRISAIVTVSLAAIAASILVYGTGFGHDPTTFFGAAFSAWLGGVAFFTLVGLAVAVVSLEKPEDASFDTRARILFRKQKGSHIEYIVSNMPTAIEHFSRSTLNRVQILEYCEAERKYRLAWATVTKVSSYIDDVRTTYKSRVHYAEVTEAPPGRLPNRLMHIRVGNDLACAGLDFTLDSITKDFIVRIGCGETVEVKVRVEAWFSIGEISEHVPARFTEALTFTIENQLRDFCSVPVEFRVAGQAEWETRNLAQAEMVTLYTGIDLFPGKGVYEYRLRAPTISRSNGALAPAPGVVI